MTAFLDNPLAYAGAALLVFALAAALGRMIFASLPVRIGVGLVGVAATMLFSISHRTLLDWCVSAIDRLSLPGFIMVSLLAINSVTGRQFRRSAEYRFASMLLALTGVAFYPSAIGLIDYDIYTWGYSGLWLPAALALVLAYAISKGYWMTMLALNLSVAAYLLGAGLSRNLWDYLIDPIAFLLALISCFVFAGYHFAGRPLQPSGDTPISH